MKVWYFWVHFSVISVAFDVDNICARVTDFCGYFFKDLLSTCSKVRAICLEKYIRGKDYTNFISALTAASFIFSLFRYKGRSSISGLRD